MLDYDEYNKVYVNFCDGDCSSVGIENKLITVLMGETKKEVNEAVKKEGWKKIKGKFYCPECQEKMKHNKKEPKQKLGRVIYKIHGFDNDGSIDFIDNGLGLNLHCDNGIYELELSDIPPFISFLKNYIGEDV